MNPTSFFLLTLLLVLVTEAAARGPREKFSQGSEEHSNENLHVRVLGGSGESSSSHEEYSRSESSWSSFKSKNPQSGFSEDGSWSSFKSKNPKSGFSEEGSWSSFKSKNPKSGFSEDGSWSSFKSKNPKSGFSEDGSWSSFKSKNPKSGFSEDGSWSSFKSKNPKSGFSEDGHLDYKTRGSRGEEGMSSFNSRMKTRIAGK